MAENSMHDIIVFLGVSGTEFREFWTSLTDAEKAEYKATDLSS